MNQEEFTVFLRAVFWHGPAGQGAGAFWPVNSLGLLGLLAAWVDNGGTGRVVAYAGAGDAFRASPASLLLPG